MLLLLLLGAAGCVEPIEECAERDVEAAEEGGANGDEEPEPGEVGCDDLLPDEQAVCLTPSCLRP